jgi:hypothetical protein
MKTHRFRRFRLPAGFLFWNHSIKERPFPFSGDMMRALLDENVIGGSPDCISPIPEILCFARRANAVWNHIISLQPLRRVRELHSVHDQLVAGVDDDRLPIGRRSGLENLDDGNQGETRRSESYRECVDMLRTSATTARCAARKQKRARFLEHFANRAPCLTGMEACGGAPQYP